MNETLFCCDPSVRNAFELPSRRANLGNGPQAVEYSGWLLCMTFNNGKTIHYFPHISCSQEAYLARPPSPLRLKWWLSITTCVTRAAWLHAANIIRHCLPRKFAASHLVTAYNFRVQQIIGQHHQPLQRLELTQAGTWMPCAYPVSPYSIASN